MKRIHFLAIAALTLSGQALADAVIGPELERRMQAGECPCEVIATFSDRSGLTGLDALPLGSLKLDALPMAGLIANNAEIDLIARLAGAESIYYNAPLEYYNFNSGEITDGHLAQDTLLYTGEGVTIAVLDSGVDADHPDLAFGSKTVENVKIVGDLGLLGGTTLFVEGVSNSDTTSGHGTHVAGTVAGTGVISAEDPRRPFANDGIAPGAKLVGLGAGEGLSILYALIGFDYAIANQDRLGIDAITNSWGCCDGAEFDPNDPINKASFEAYRRGMVVLFAASNSGPAEDTINKYATPPWAISVAAGTPTRTLADFSSRGVAGHPYKHPDVMAPGESITSTRAPNTVIGATGPVTDPIEYYPYYHTISGTSMATPFVAGTTALLLEANPQLSPDQVLEILMATAEPVEGREFHEVGAGHINVLDALVLAEETAGERVQFLQGQTRWSANGEWNRIDDTDSRLQLVGKWRERSDGDALEGSVSWIDARHGGHLLARFDGETLRLPLPRDKQGGLADVYIDGIKRGRVSYFDSDGVNSDHAFTELGDGLHTLELVPVDGRTYFDGLRLSGRLFDVSVELVETTTTFTGVMGPSAENTTVHTIEFEVGPSTIGLEGVLNWQPFADLDFRLLDPSGNEVASAASLDTPEVIVFDVGEAGTYTWVVDGYVSVLTEYTLDGTQTEVRVVE